MRCTGSRVAAGAVSRETRTVGGPSCITERFAGIRARSRPNEEIRRGSRGRDFGPRYAPRHNGVASPVSSLRFQRREPAHDVLHGGSSYLPDYGRLLSAVCIGARATIRIGGVLPRDTWGTEPGWVVRGNFAPPGLRQAGDDIHSLCPFFSAAAMLGPTHRRFNAHWLMGGDHESSDSAADSTALLCGLCGATRFGRGEVARLGKAAYDCSCTVVRSLRRDDTYVARLRSLTACVGRVVSSRCLERRTSGAGPAAEDARWAPRSRGTLQDSL